jgi:DNA (cytosine-5)-methyltransferase 1
VRAAKSSDGGAALGGRPQRRPRLLDLFCGAGGAAMGWAMAGFEVVGVDNRLQPNYPFEFELGDALEFLDGIDVHGNGWAKGSFDVIHASPPCQYYANVTRWRGDPDDHPDLLGLTLEALDGRRTPWIVENVPEAIPDPDLTLCGSMFDLSIQRHRHFLSSMPLAAPQAPCKHGDLFPFMHKGERSYADAMGCAWMSSREAREAIPPAYTRWIAGQVLAMLGRDRAPATRWARCQRCGNVFHCQRSDARYCSGKCREKASYHSRKTLTVKGVKRQEIGPA